jgi:hypothetical protein
MLPDDLSRVQGLPLFGLRLLLSFHSICTEQPCSGREPENATQILVENNYRQPKRVHSIGRNPRAVATT